MLALDLWHGIPKKKKANGKINKDILCDVISFPPAFFWGVAVLEK